jgi:hypothetical protein
VSKSAVRKFDTVAFSFGHIRSRFASPSKGLPVTEPSCEILTSGRCGDKLRDLACLTRTLRVVLVEAQCLHLRESPSRKACFRSTWLSELHLIPPCFSYLCGGYFTVVQNSPTFYHMSISGQRTTEVRLHFFAKTNLGRVDSGETGSVSWPPIPGLNFLTEFVVKQALAAVLSSVSHIFYKAKIPL